MNLSRIQKHGLIVSVILAAGVVVAQGAWGFHWRIQEAQFGRGLKAYNNKDYAAALTAWSARLAAGVRSGRKGIARG